MENGPRDPRHPIYVALQRMDESRGGHTGSVLGAADAERAQLAIWAHDGVFAVGGVDRGEFVITYELGTESEACEYVLGAIRRNAAVSEQSPQERRGGRAVKDDVPHDY